MIEYEKKIMLSKEEYRYLKKTRFLDVLPLVQKNHYYDTADFTMHKNGITCRIREIGEKFITYVKDHSGNSKECSVENCFGIHDYLNDVFFRKAGLFYQGYNCTERLSITSGKIKIILDKTDYLDITDYELEIEYENGFESTANNELHIIAKELFDNGLISNIDDFVCRNCQNKNKAARFFDKKTSL